MLRSFFILVLVAVSANAQTFVDVPPSHIFYAEVEEANERGLMVGYGDGRFGVNDPLPRWQAAVILGRAAFGTFEQPNFTGTVFDDVESPQDAYFGGWVEDFKARGITSGCSTNPPLFCPYEATTREQIAAFIIRSRGEFNPAPPVPGTFRFMDVDPSSPFYSFIHRMRALGITRGCGQFVYCPNDVVTRGMMAAMVVRAFAQ